MRRGTLFLAALLALMAWLGFRFSSPDVPPQLDATASSERTPVCPWRGPQGDLSALFPPATNYVTEKRILSSKMAPIQKRLGRAMTADENPLRIFHVPDQDHWRGSVLLCRVKGEHGGIEIVTGVETNGAVRGVLIQSQREPEAVARVITNTTFLASFPGKTAAAPLRLGEDLPDVPAEARASAQAIADGVRSQLIVLSFAEQSLETRSSRSHTNH